MIFEGATHIWRNIYMDGRPHPSAETLTPTWLGHSVGRWEGETLVIDVVGFNEGSWIDMGGKPHTSKLHLVERFTARIYSRCIMKRPLTIPAHTQRHGSLPLM